ncbi:MAG: hypothetical protein HFF89_08185 [Oscillibacter sp.]|jgi:hypothetical protein|nr:hypothetical protein [Oscillibacter sp.]MCI8690975.1 hypothetical protein [Oscillibacter sp.]
MNYRQLKIFAVVCMVFDHVVRIFPLDNFFAPLGDFFWNCGWNGLSDWLMNDFTLYLMFIGRLAAPIFLYCITLGFLHTSNVWRYLRRILITAVIAQVPYTLFDLAESRLYNIEGDWRETGLNILFTLTLGLLVLIVHEELKKRKLIIFSPLVLAAATWLAVQLSMEGGKGYIFLIFIYYICRNCTRWQKVLLFIPAIMLSRYGLVWWVIESIGTEEFTGALRNCVLNVLGNYFGMLVTLTYNGEKGKTGKGFQFFMYAFYPAHFALLALIGFLRPPLL